MGLLFRSAGLYFCVPVPFFTNLTKEVRILFAVERPPLSFFGTGWDTNKMQTRVLSEARIKGQIRFRVAFAVTFLTTAAMAVGLIAAGVRMLVGK